MQADWVHVREKVETYNPNQPEILQEYLNIKTHSNHPRFSIGYDFGNWRLALDYSHYDRCLENVRFKTHEASFGVRYRFQLNKFSFLFKRSNSSHYLQNEGKI
ncbi:opacity family porin [Haemophilus influenzae]|uniref:pseudouridine synthase n=1 Tax=Haemophilus influenzae TaxID=727 RepID=UPI000E5798A3|nr:pseudouridine synthase [Haemophilus influenzae]MCK8794421.1 opacity family porin [Haemophilus influenzae]MCK8829330.1 opacity family porin [Haemophilus influenzae]MCK8839621.1 opacity family porin [Haemophilus influenzae]